MHSFSARFIAGLSIVGGILGVGTLVVVALGTRLQFFGEQPSPSDDHRARMALVGVLVVVSGVALIVRLVLGSSGPPLLVVVPALVLSVMWLGWLGYRHAGWERTLAERHAAAGEWIATLHLPDGVPVVENGDETVDLDSYRSTVGSVWIVVVPDDVDGWLVDLDAAIVANGATPIASRCDDLVRQYRYARPDDSWVDLTVEDWRLDEGEVRVATSYRRDSDLRVPQYPPGTDTCPAI